jgi:ABC-type Fe3+/spermidine/putrescine transport system ATPase subunit
VIVATVLGELRCEVPKNSAPEEAKSVKVGIRPDHVRLRAIDESVSTNGELIGELRSSIFLGPWVRYEVAVGDVTLHARTPVSPEVPRIDPGSRVRVSIADGCARVLNTDASRPQ